MSPSLSLFLLSSHPPLRQILRPKCVSLTAFYPEAAPACDSLVSDPTLPNYHPAAAPACALVLSYPTHPVPFEHAQGLR